MPEYSWSDRPADKYKGRMIFGVIIITLTGIVIFWAAGNNFIFGILAMALMVFASSRFYFPSHYYVDEKGIGEKFLGYKKARKWNEFARADIGKNAVFLSPFEEPKFLERYRGLFVPTPSDEIKDFIVRMVESKGKKDIEPNETES